MQNGWKFTSKYMWLLLILAVKMQKMNAFPLAQSFDIENGLLYHKYNFIHPHVT